MKDSFIFHLNNNIELEDLNDAEVGQLFRAMISYTESGIAPEFEDRALRMAWRRIKDRLDDDNKKYFEKCEKNKANGSKGGRPKTKKNRSVMLGYENAEKENSETQPKPKKADSESESESDSDIYIYNARESAESRTSSRGFNKNKSSPKSKKFNDIQSHDYDFDKLSKISKLI